MRYVATTENVADALTKVLPEGKLRTLLPPMCLTEDPVTLEVYGSTVAHAIQSISHRMAFLEFFDLLLYNCGIPICEVDWYGYHVWAYVRTIVLGN